MKKSELVQLRKLVNNEIIRRTRINDLLDEDLVLEYLKLTNGEIERLDADIDTVIKDIIKSFEIRETNGIYVCVGAYYIDYDICYEETNYYSRKVGITSSKAEYKIYSDIEDRKLVKANANARFSETLISDFENNNIVLNPYNSYKNNNGYNEVRELFFEKAIKEGQSKSKKLILTKYPKI